jgi:hypothetical protein
MLKAAVLEASTMTQWWGRDSQGLNDHINYIHWVNNSDCEKVRNSFFRCYGTSMASSGPRVRG